MASRVTQTAAQVLVEPNPGARVTQTAVQVLHKSNASAAARVTQEAAQVLAYTTPPSTTPLRARAYVIG